MQEEIYVTQEDMFSGVRHRGNFALDRLEAKEYFPILRKLCHRNFHQMLSLLLL